MSAFDEKICEFLTQTDNWPIAREIFEKMPAIQEQLRNNFWKDMKVGLEKKINPAEWKIIGPGIIDSNKYNGDSGLCIARLTWKNLFYIGFGGISGQTYLSVWCDSDSEKVKTQYDVIADGLIKSDKNLTKDPQWFPAWFYTGDNFSEWSTIDRSLPHNRKVMVEKYISMLFELTEKAKVVIDDVVE